jgi:uncharacterized protein with PQ loop repeat
MNNDIGQGIGIAAAILSVAYIIPQIQKIKETRNSDSFSCESLYITLLSSVLWFIYGLYFNLYPVIMTHTILVGFKIYHLHLHYLFNPKLKKPFIYHLFQSK